MAAYAPTEQAHTPVGPDRTPFRIKGLAGQAANLQEWLDSNDQVVASIGPAGVLTVAGGVTEAAAFAGNKTISGTLTAGTATPVAATILTLKGATADAAAFSLTAQDSAGLTVFTINNQGRIDATNRTGEGPPFVLTYKPAVPANNDRAGHYAFAALDSISQQNTIAFLDAYITDVTHTSMDSKIRLSWMENVDGTPGLQQPNTIAEFSGTGTKLPGYLAVNQGVTAPTGILQVGGSISDPAQAAILLSPTMPLSTTAKSGILANPQFNPSTTVAQMYAMLFTPTMRGTNLATGNNVTNWDGIFCRCDTNADFDSNITSIYNFRAAGSSHSGAGTIANIYGFYSQVATGVATANWQLYCAGNAPSFVGGLLYMGDGQSILPAANTTGLNIGFSAANKVGFHDAAPTAQRSGAVQAAAPAGGTGATAGAYDTSANRDAMIALVNEMRTVLVTKGLMKGSA